MKNIILFLVFTCIISLCSSRSYEPSNNVTAACPKNEVFSPCPQCDGCDQRYVTCNIFACVPGCTCKPGYYRNRKGKCVESKKCECPENEQHDNCINSCPEKCQDIDVVNLDYCPSHPGPDQGSGPSCRSGCRCRKNYKRNSAGVCIPIENCPHENKCGANEDWVACHPMPLCIEERCIQYPPILCAYLWDGTCVPRCLCKKGYCRNESGQCIKIPTCSKNEEYCRNCCPVEGKCPGEPSTVWSFSNENPMECSVGCVCSAGYVRSSKKGCVRPQDCR